MPTCPDCGSIIMEGDPYCPHCGAHLQWDFEDDSNENYSRDELDDIVDSMFIDISQKLLLKSKLRELLAARDCTGLEARLSIDEYVFRFTRQNEYVRTVDELYYNPRDATFSRLFCDCMQFHVHDKLLSHPKFKALLRRTPYEFLECRGGYVTQATNYPHKFYFVDEIDVIVYFRVSANKERFYHLDLEKMQLKNDYHEYEV